MSHNVLSFSIRAVNEVLAFIIRLINYSRVNEKSLEWIKRLIVIESLCDKESSSRYNLDYI